MGGVGQGGTQEDRASPRFGSPWEERGAGGQVPTGGPEQMAKGIIKIQLCSHQRLGLKEGGGSRVAQPRLSHCPSLWSRFFCHDQDVKSSLSRERLPLWAWEPTLNCPLLTLG